MKKASVTTAEPGLLINRTATVESRLPTVKAVDSKVVGLNGGGRYLWSSWSDIMAATPPWFVLLGSVDGRAASWQV